MKNLSINKKHISSFILAVSVAILSSCGMNINSLNSDNMTISTTVAKNILRNTKKISIKEKDLPFLFTAFYSENKIISHAARKVLLENSDKSLHHFLNLLTNETYSMNTDMTKYKLALRIFNDFPDSLEKVEFLSIITRKIAQYDKKMARSLILKIEMMEERIPQNNLKDHKLIKIYKKAIGLQLNPSNALSQLKDTLDLIKDTKPESLRFKMLKHFSIALSEVYLDVDKSSWKFIEKRFKSLSSLTRRTRGLVLLANIQLDHDPDYAVELMKSINTGYNGQQYYYIIDMLDLFPDYTISDLLKLAKKMARNISDKSKKIKALEEIAHASIDYDYSFARNLVSDLEADDSKRSRLLAELAISVNTERPETSRYLQSLIIYSSNRVRYYTAALAGRYALTNVQAVSNLLEPALFNNPYVKAELLSSKPYLQDNIKQEVFYQLLENIRQFSISEKEKYKIRFIVNLSHSNPALSHSLFDKSVQHLITVENNPSYPELVALWSDAILKIDNYSVQFSLDKIINKSLTITNKAHIQKVLDSSIQSLAVQDIRYSIKHLSRLKPETALKIMNNWLSKNKDQKSIQLLSSLLALSPEYPLSDEILHSANKWLILTSVAVSGHTNVNLNWWESVFDQDAPYSLIESSFDYYSQVYNPALIAYSLASLTNGDHKTLTPLFLDMLKQQQDSVDWKNIATDLLRQLKKNNLSSPGKSILVQLNTLANNKESIFLIRKLLKSSQSSSSLKKVCINSLAYFNDKESIDSLVRLSKEERYFSQSLQALVKLKAYNSIEKSYRSGIRKDEIVEVLMVHAPEKINKKLGYIGYIIPEAYYHFQLKGYPITQIQDISNAKSLGLNYLVKGKYHTEFNDTVKFSSSETEKELKGEYHLMTLDFLNSDGNTRWQIRATGYGSAWSENVVDGKEDPQYMINYQANKWVTREFKRKLKNQASMIPFNFK